MSKPIFHAVSSARINGGTPEDYLAIHDFMDSSKGAIPDNRHRALTHNSWFLSNVLERVFGNYLLVEKRDEGKIESVLQARIREKEAELAALKEELRLSGLVRVVSVREIGEQHCLEDFNKTFIPTASDYLQEMDLKDWMNQIRGATPPSHAKIAAKRTTRRIDWD